MSKKVSGDPFCPPQEFLKADLRSEEIYEFLKQVKCSYPQEIMVEVNISKDTLFRRLRLLEKEGKIKRMFIEDAVSFPKWLEHRKAHLWARGLKGNAIRRMSWYLVVDDGKKKD